MSSVIKTINALKEIHIRYYIQFHKDKFGYVEDTLPNVSIRIIEDNEYLRPRCYNEKKNLVASVPKNGNSPYQNRAFRQPPVPSSNNNNNNNIILINS